MPAAAIRVKRIHPAVRRLRGKGGIFTGRTSPGVQLLVGRIRQKVDYDKDQGKHQDQGLG